MDAPQVAARALRSRIVSREAVERLAARRAREPLRATSQQRAVAAEAGAERRQPPPAVGRGVGERGGEHEVDERRWTGCRTRAASPRCSEGIGVEFELRSSASSTSRPPACRIHAAMSALCEPVALSTVPSTRCACSAASFGTSRVRMLRSMPSRCSNISALRSPARSASVLSVPGDRGAPPRAAAREHRRAGAVAEQAGADQHAGVVVEVHRGAADLDADRQHVPARPRPAARGRAAGSARRPRSPGRRGRRPGRRRAGRAARRRSRKGPGTGSRCRC